MITRSNFGLQQTSCIIFTQVKLVKMIAKPAITQSKDAETSRVEPWSHFKINNEKNKKKILPKWRKRIIYIFLCRIFCCWFQLLCGRKIWNWWCSKLSKEYLEQPLPLSYAKKPNNNVYKLVWEISNNILKTEQFISYFFWSMSISTCYWLNALQ